MQFSLIQITCLVFLSSHFFWRPHFLFQTADSDPCWWQWWFDSRFTNLNEISHDQDRVMVLILLIVSYIDIWNRSYLIIFLQLKQLSNGCFHFVLQESNCPPTLPFTFYPTPLYPILVLHQFFCPNYKTHHLFGSSISHVPSINFDLNFVNLSILPTPSPLSDFGMKNFALLSGFPDTGHPIIGCRDYRLQSFGYLR